MAPPAGRLPDVLPTARLTASAMPVPEVRSELRRINDLRNVGAVALAWVHAAVTIGLAVWVAHPVGYVAAVILMGPVFARFAILAHEAAHKLLFTDKRINDWVGRWLIGYPAFVPLDVYRRGHFAHHKDEFGPNEPDMNLYVDYPVSRASLRRKLVRDAIGISGWKNLLPLLRSSVHGGATTPVARRILCTQVVLFAGFTAFGRPELYLLLWLLPWMTSWRVLNRLRSIAEHGGMERNDDRRRTTHHVRQTRLANFFIVPLNTGWHLAHHVDMGVPWRNLPALHTELVDAGWVTPDLEYRNYRALWRALASGANA
ncbi:fatty acid desaturase family protein [soil metagenome]